MDERDWLADRFEEKRGHLKAVAFRMLGSSSEADDAVQESWLRMSRAGAEGVDNLGGWLTTVVARVCLDMLRSRKSRREEPLMPVSAPGDRQISPEDRALLADSIGLALVTVLDTLPPPERVAFVLHDMFDVPFDEIAPIVGRSAVAARQLASRARRRVKGASRGSGADRARQRQVVEAFLAASRAGDFNRLLALLDPDAVLHSDEAAVRMGASKEVRGAAEVAKTFAGRAQAAQLALIDGRPGVVWMAGGRPRVVFVFTVERERISGIDLVADVERLGKLELKP